MLHAAAECTAARDEARPKSADDVISFKDHGEVLTDAGFKALAVFKNMEKLDVRYSLASDAAMRSFAALDRLTSLDLRGTEITDASLKLLAAKKSLTTLNVQSTHVTEAGVRELQSALPRCAIKH